MEIDRSNYELWVIDYLDGNLNADQLIKYKRFLSDNPDIKQEADFFEQIRITPAEKPFLFKKSLLKNTSELSDEQFSFMCIANAENDLSAYQSEELLEIIKNNPQKQKSYELIKKIKLKPGNIIYANKRQLKKSVILTKRTLRITIAGLGIAASIALLIISYGGFREKENLTKPVIALTSNQPDSIYQSNTIDTSGNTNREPKQIIISPKKIDQATSEPLHVEEITTPLPEVINISKLPLPETTYITSIILPGQATELSLVPVNSILHPQINIEETSKLKNYITGFFRSRILKDQEPETGTLKGYEIADAGITGLNKLLGWDMSFEKVINENGELSNLVFSSRLVKFNTPVKNFETNQ